VSTHQRQLHIWVGVIEDADEARCRRQRSQQVSHRLGSAADLSVRSRRMRYPAGLYLTCSALFSSLSSSSLIASVSAVSPSARSLVVAEGLTQEVAANLTSAAPSSARS
jgi:hypothetical protein